MKIGIVGGGMMGVTAGYHLSKQGHIVELFEASSDLGGLANTIELEDGIQVDRFYHTLLPSDNNLHQLCAELEIAEKIRFNKTNMGFYHQGQVHSMNDMVDFLRFSPLNWIDRFRLGITVLYAQLVRDWRSLEEISVEKWLINLSGRRTYENVWRPMLKAKFDGDFDDIPATYIWSRLVRMKSTRSGVEQKEQAGYLIGGYKSLVDAMAEAIETEGGKIHINCPAREIIIDGQQTAKGLRTDQGIHACDAIVVTLSTPLFLRLISQTNEHYRYLLNQNDCLGLVCPLLVLDRPLTNFWTLYITDDHIPFTGIIETTTYIDPKHVGGHHLVYLPKYTAPGSSLQDKTDEEIQEIWLHNLESMFPEFNKTWIRFFAVHRERHVEPLHRCNMTDLIPDIETPAKHLFLANTAQIYPALTNCESVSLHARKAVQIIKSLLDFV